MDKKRGDKGEGREKADGLYPLWMQGITTKRIERWEGGRDFAGECFVGQEEWCKARLTLI